MLVRLECKPVNVTLISIYSPVNPNGQRDAAEMVDAFYTKLQSTIENILKDDMILIMGDFNARVGAQQQQTAHGIIGPNTVDKLNENGRRLLDFCSINDLIICNTFFQHKGRGRINNGNWAPKDSLVILSRKARRAFLKQI